MMFKVGDRVRITEFSHKNKVGKVGVVIETYFSEFPKSKYPYRIKVGNWDCPMMEGELELALKKGEQLSFSFMSE